MEAQTLSLDSCKNLAVENNRKIKEANFNISISEEQKKGAFTHYFPQANAMLFGMKTSDYLLKGSTPDIPVLEDPAAATPVVVGYLPSFPIKLIDYLNTAAVTITQPIFTGGRVVNGNRLAKTAISINREKQAMTTTDVLVKTEEYYWTVISLSEKTKTLELYKKMLDTLQRDVEVSYKAGLVQRTDLLKVQLKLNEIEMNQLKLHNGINLAKQALCQHIGIVYDSTIALSTPVKDPEPPRKFYVQPDVAVGNRSEYKMLNDAIRVEELQKRITVGEHLPQVAIGAAGYYLDMIDNSSTNTLAFATISIPITDWWEGKHKIRQNQIRIENARNQLDETSELLKLQIEQTNNDLIECYFQVEVAKKSVQQAAENLKISSDNYRAGIISMSDLLEAQSVWQGTLDSLTEARCSYQIKKAKYQQATSTYRLN
ncbi:MAG: TolC family protein [Bacteroidales bacterium]